MWWTRKKVVNFHKIMVTTSYISHTVLWNIVTHIFVLNIYSSWGISLKKLVSDCFNNNVKKTCRRPPSFYMTKPQKRNCCSRGYLHNCVNLQVLICWSSAQKESTNRISILAGLRNRHPCCSSFLLCAAKLCEKGSGFMTAIRVSTP